MKIRTILVNAEAGHRNAGPNQGEPLRKPFRLLIGGGVLVTALIATTAPAQAAAPVVLSTGHVDIVDVAYEDGALEIGVHDETVEPGVEREVDDVVFLVRNGARTAVPADPSFAFLGAAGQPTWILPEIQNEDLLWPGIATEEIESGVFAGDTVTLKVEKVTGAGRVAVFTENAVGTPNVLVNSADGLPDAVSLEAGSHLHASWAFSKAGIYLIKVRATGTLVDGTTVTSDPAVYKVVVQP
jgi:surface-anchored protein